MSAVTALQSRYDAITARLSGNLPESLVLAFVRVVLAGVFWRSGRTKVVEGSWFQLSDTTYELFRTEYAGVPLPPEFAAVMATTAEHVLPALLLVGAVDPVLRARAVGDDDGDPILRLSRRLVAGAFALGGLGVDPDRARGWPVQP
jgi:hypothetical protein